MSEDLVIEHYGGSEVGEVLEIITGLYKASHADVIADDPFLSTDRFHARLDGYRDSPGFEAAIAYDGGQPIGLAFGYNLPRNAPWWDGMITAVDPKLIAETGTRTFALCEIMVHPEQQGRGVARSLHTDLMAQRREKRATLLVRRDNDTAQAAYARWGYRLIGRLQPFTDAPVYDALVLDLPIPR